MIENPAAQRVTERYKSPFPLPEAYDRELLVILAEECCEVAQRVTKALRFGLNETQPGQPLDNATRLAREIGDLACVTDRLIEAGVIDPREIAVGRVNKAAQLDRFLQTEKSRVPNDAAPNPPA